MTDRLDTWWKSVLSCPKCKGILNTNGDIFVCQNCESRFKVKKELEEIDES